MKKQLLLTTLALAAIGGYLHANESKLQDDNLKPGSTEEVTKETKKNNKLVVAKVVAAKVTEENKADITKDKEYENKEKEKQ